MRPDFVLLFYVNSAVVIAIVPDQKSLANVGPYLYIWPRESLVCLCGVLGDSKLKVTDK